MADFLTPLASAMSAIEFSQFHSDEIRRISVKRIHATPALDSMLGPIPGGLHDLALGSIQALDANCSTCRLSHIHCPGHSGHIDLPVPCYHPAYIDVLLRLLRSKCVYCHKLRASREHVNRTICSLRLLQHGLIEENHVLKNVYGRSRKGAKKAEDSESEEDDDELMERRIKYVDKSIKKARRRDRNDRLAYIRNPLANETRKEAITDFLKSVALYKKCSHCGGISPPYRKDRKVKIFQMPLAPKARSEMRNQEMHAPNPLLFLVSERKQRLKVQKPLTNGWHHDDLEMTNTDAVGEKHGAEEEIALHNALETNVDTDSNHPDTNGDSQSYMTSTEVHAALTLLFDREQEVFSLLFPKQIDRRSQKCSPDMFFMTALLVPSNKFRPLAKQGVDQVLEAQQNGALNRIIKASNELRQILRDMRRYKKDNSIPTRNQDDRVNASIILQESVNDLIDQVPNPSRGINDPGIRQTLEKKEGLFRMHMMGKRVNFAARSVISPDPNIETNEIGVPMVFAKKLTYAEPVTRHNLKEMMQAVRNGMEQYPGAAAIENENGLVMSLKRKSKDQRKALSEQLLTSTVPSAKGDQSKKVYRHLQTGDVVIMNRQPTLHKPSMMGHRARVLTNQKTIRMHYANCNTYNADFDGDEMNMHFPQNELARTEALQIADTDHQYLSSTAGKPLRGLIQDHISMGVQFTSRDVFFDREQYQQLLYNCLRPEEFNSVSEKISTIPPAILKPQMLWSGKQVITTVLKNLIPINFRGLNLTSKSSTSAEQWGETPSKFPEKWTVTKESIVFRDTEQVVIFQDGEHLCGILDKAQLGPTAGGLVHSVYEVYGHITAGKLLSVLGRLLTRVLNERAWTCGMDDLYLTSEGDRRRREELEKSAGLGHDVSANYVTLNPREIQKGDSKILVRLEAVLRNDDQLNGLDQVYNSKTRSITESVSKACLPNGLRKPFPRNQMQAMTLSGAKGSNVNANLISCNLGQQVLEGRRVPSMVSGKSLPSFRAYETDPVAGGYVSGRFLTGIKPQEYFFHAMSGREGLIDTAVKTATSGYLQRCVVKGLEGMKAEYDSSVRETASGSIIQFLYGEDGLEVTKQKHLREFTFLGENMQSLAVQMNAGEVFDTISKKNLAEEQKSILKMLRKGHTKDPITALYPPSANLGSTSESFSSDLAKYVKNNPDRIIKDKKTNPSGMVSKKTFLSIMDLKYMKSVVEAGETVGVVAAQSVGEPSTQMTLNTFHLAGHSAKNVTLGIPRLREILMTASANIKLPTMTLKPIEELSVDDGKRFAKSISRLPLAHVVSTLSVTERSSGSSGHEHERLYEINIEFFDPEEYTEEYAIQTEDILIALEFNFLPQLNKSIKADLKKKNRESSRTIASAAMPEIGATVGRVEEARNEDPQNEEKEGGEEANDEDVDFEDAKNEAAKIRREDIFDEPDDDEKDLVAKSDDEESNEEGSSHPKGMRRRHKQPQNIREKNPEDSEELGSTDSETEARFARLKGSIPHLKRFNFVRNEGRSCRIVLAYSSNTPKLLLLPMVEKSLHDSVVQSIPGLGVCALYMEEVRTPDGKPVKQTNPETGQEEDLKEPVITTQGVNLLAMRDYQDIINPHNLYTNSVNDMLRFYGVEAARMAIVKEVDGVFKGHGISVNTRHLNLIADAMTHWGSYLGFNRHGMVKENSSVLAKMSFETVMGVLKDAVIHGENDPLLGPSARIVAGRRSNLGTGSFDIVVPVN